MPTAFLLLLTQAHPSTVRSCRSAFRSLKNVVLVDGCRLPFQPSGTVYNKLVAYDLARLALTGILTKTGVSPKQVNYCLMGTVIQEVSSSLNTSRPTKRLHPCGQRTLQSPCVAS